MIWRKTWLESRGRFLLTALILALTVVWWILDANRQMARYDIKPAMTFTRYVSIVYGGHIQLFWVASCIILGLGGLVRERAQGTAQFTLVLPISRQRWMAMRAAVAAAEAAVLALVPVIVIPIAATLIGRSYPPWEALKFSALLFFSGIVFLSLSLLYSSVLPGDVAAVGAGAVSVYLAFNSQNYFYYWLPIFNISRFMSGFEFLDLRTGFLTGCPWFGIFASLSITSVLLWVAVQMIRRQDF
jgi:ABC-type transport system involved in multi-copper enzyme maturation permease subunit